MISEETAIAIATAHRETRVARELLDKIDAGERENRPPDILDCYGRPRGLQLGVPTSDTTQRLFTVSHAAAKLILGDHIERQRAEIERLSNVALAEIAAAGGGMVVLRKTMEMESLVEKAARHIGHEVIDRVRRFMDEDKDFPGRTEVMDDDLSVLLQLAGERAWQIVRPNSAPSQGPSTQGDDGGPRPERP